MSEFSLPFTESLIISGFTTETQCIKGPLKEEGNLAKRIQGYKETCQSFCAKITWIALTSYWIQCRTLTDFRPINSSSGFLHYHFIKQEKEQSSPCELWSQWARSPVVCYQVFLKGHQASYGSLVSRQDPSQINGKVGPFTFGNSHSPSLLALYFLRTFLPLDT